MLVVFNEAVSTLQWRLLREAFPYSAFKDGGIPTDIATDANSIGALDGGTVFVWASYIGRDVPWWPNRIALVLVKDAHGLGHVVGLWGESARQGRPLPTLEEIYRFGARQASLRPSLLAGLSSFAILLVIFIYKYQGQTQTQLAPASLTRTLLSFVLIFLTPIVLGWAVGALQRRRLFTRATA